MNDPMSKLIQARAVILKKKQEEEEPEYSPKSKWLDSAYYEPEDDGELEKDRAKYLRNTRRAMRLARDE
jgi:hypothetical protein